MARLGVALEPVDADGQVDIVGVPEDLCRHFSSRRREIEAAGAVRVAAAEARLGRSLTADERAEAFQVVTLATRPAKGRAAEATESLVERWMTEAAAFGRSPENWLDQALGRSPAQLGLPLEATGDVAAKVVVGAGLARLGGLEAEAERARFALQDVEPVAVQAQGRFRELVAAGEARDAWIAEHPVEVAWMEDLAERVAERRSELALAAEEHRPAHILRLLGPAPVAGAAREC